MKMALLSTTLPSDSKGGVGYQVHAMANGLVGRGHSVTVFSVSPKPSDAAYEHRSCRVEGSLRTLRISWRMRSIDWSAFDVLHAHGDDWLLWNRSVPPHVRTVHGTCLEEAWHVPGLRHKARMLWLAGLETMSCTVADRTVAVSKNTKRLYPWIREVIPNGVDLSLFHPGEKEAVPTILFVGTYEHRKRGKLLMDVFVREVRPRVPEAQLWMVCSDAPAAPGVEVLGRLSTEELADRYRRAWVFCLPSTYEGFGVPYIEAMASGTAVVATENVGAREVLEDGRWGRIVDDDKLGAALLELLQDRSQREALERAGRERAGVFGWPNVLNAYERIYAEVIGSREAIPNRHTGH